MEGQKLKLEQQKQSHRKTKMAVRRSVPNFDDFRIRATSRGQMSLDGAPSDALSLKKCATFRNRDIKNQEIVEACQEIERGSKLD